MKRFVIFLILAVVIASGVFTQERAQNTVLGGIHFNPLLLGLGLDVEYERTFPDLLPGTFAVAAEAGIATVLVIPIGFNIDARARYYIKADGNGFFADLGVGYGTLVGLPSLQFSVGAGWRFDIGQPNGWVLVPSLQGNYFLGLSKKDPDDNIFGDVGFTGLLFKLNVRIGYSF